MLKWKSSEISHTTAHAETHPSFGRYQSSQKGLFGAWRPPHNGNPTNVDFLMVSFAKLSKEATLKQKRVTRLDPKKDRRTKVTCNYTYSRVHHCPLTNKAPTKYVGVTSFWGPPRHVGSYFGLPLESTQNRDTLQKRHTISYNEDKFSALLLVADWHAAYSSLETAGNLERALEHIYGAERPRSTRFGSTFTKAP